MNTTDKFIRHNQAALEAEKTWKSLRASLGPKHPDTQKAWAKMMRQDHAARRAATLAPRLGNGHPGATN